jgi:site-specific DNA-methyltransferase (adenine-specific)
MTGIAYNVIKSPTELKSHPLNIEIYGLEVADTDLVESIRSKGILEPIVIKNDNTILSGHRRWMAARDLKLDKVPCRVITFSDPLDEVEALIEFNRQRSKTVSQKIKEKHKLEWIGDEKKKALERQKATQAKPGEKIGEGGVHLDTTLPKGKTREKIAEKIGMSVGTMLRAETVFEKAQEGNKKAAELMKQVDTGEIKINTAYIKVKEIIAAEKEDIAKPPVASNNVFGNTCEIESISSEKLGVPINTRNKTDGIAFMQKLPDASIPCVFFDPQYRGVLDALSYGNEGDRQQDRVMLDQMTTEIIQNFCKEIDRILVPSGHLFLWVDKFHLVEGTKQWFEGTNIKTVDLLTWNKETFGMGFRTRRVSEYLLILQKLPTRAKGIWSDHTIRDIWSEKTNGEGGEHAHKKPIGLQSALIKSVTREGDVVLDPAAGSFSVMISANKVNRNFVGCDIEG